jgi:hypothetical protein
MSKACQFHRLYPVDKARVNEFGYSYDQDDAASLEGPPDSTATTPALAATEASAANIMDAAAAAPSGTGLRKRIAKV